MSNYLRSTSLCADPREQLQQCVQENDLDGIEKLVENNHDILQQEYENGKTILEQACDDFAAKVNGKTIKKLLDLGADPMHSNEIWIRKSALHFAALGQNADIVKAIITSLPNEDRNATANGNTALHTIVKEVDTPKESYMECIRVLADNGVDIRRGDKRNNTVLYWAARKGQEKVVKYLLSKDGWVTEKEACELRKLPQVSAYGIIGQDTENPKSALEYLRAKNQEKFLEKLRIDPKDNDDNDEESFLQYACFKHLMDVVEHLAGDNPNKVGTNNKTPPLTIAVINGYHEIVELLLKSPKIIIPPDILNETLKRIDYDSTTHSNFKRCCELILNHTSSADVNAKDALGNYPLHYAAKYGGKKLVQELLKRKASLANRDAFNYLTIHDIDHDSLKEHFDSCIEAHPDDNTSKEGMFLTFDYTTLMPSPPAKDNITPHNGDCENVKLQVARQQFTKECEVVLYMSKDPEQKVLLQHPLIVSFLNVKWHRVRMLFYMNLLVYLLFCLALLAHILSNYDEPAATFGLSYSALLITAVVITVREAMQMMIMTRKYIKNIDNYIEIGLLIDVYLILFWTTATDHARRQLYAFGILLAALELLFLLGSVPGLSTYIIMLRTVSYNFCKFLMFNAILILAFAFSFYTLFRKLPRDAPQDNEPKAEEDEDKEKAKLFFANIYIALFKTLVMLTGEFEAASLDFDQFPVTSHLIFILFVVLIAIILLNLLNGLAVSDTHEIKSEAKLVALTARAQYISYIESLAFDSFFRFRDDCMCNATSGLWKTNALSRSIMSRVSIARVFLDEQKQLKVFANQGGRIEIQDAKAKYVRQKCNYCVIALDENTVKKARMIAAERHAAEEHVDQFVKLDEILNRLKHLEDKLN